MPVPVTISGGPEDPSVTVTPEELDVLVSAGIVKQHKFFAGDAQVQNPYDMDDVKSMILGIRNPDVV